MILKHSVKPTKTNQKALKFHSTKIILGDSMRNSNIEKNKKYCETIEIKIKLDAKPVAMKLIKTEDDIIEGYDLIDEKIRHCEMVRKASLGNKF